MLCSQGFMKNLLPKPTGFGVVPMKQLGSGVGNPTQKQLFFEFFRDPS